MKLLKYFIITAIIVYLAILITDKIFKFIEKKKNKVGIHLIFLNHTLKAIYIIFGGIVVATQISIFKDFLGTILMSSSLIVAVLAFAAQESLSNVINGLFITIFKPFDIGDRIKLVNQNLTGIVEGISLRHISLRTLENNLIIIPNSVINKEMIENINIKNSICNFLDISISYESDLKKAKEIISEILIDNPLFLAEASNNSVMIMVRELADSGVILRVSVWTRTIADNFELSSYLREKILTEFPKNNIEIPYPHIKVVKD